MARLHALILPFPQQGHISPLLQLAQHLAACHGFRITFVNTEYNHSRLLRDRTPPNDAQTTTQSASSINMMGLPDGLPMDDSRTLADMGRLLHSMAEHMQPLLEQLIHDINDSSDRLSCIISDIYLPWVPLLARRTHIPAVLGFHASSIGLFSLLYHIPLLLSSGQVNSDGSVKSGVERLSGIPGLMDVPITVLTWSAGNAKRTEATFKALGTVQSDVAKYDGVLFNSFAELEGAAMEALDEAEGVKMAAVGPTLLLEQAQEMQTSSGQDVGCLQWLDRQAEHSVLYVAFGTMVSLRGQDLQALALGLEASQVPFLWVVRDDQTAGQGCAQLPEGFLDRIKGFAYLTSWAPQTLVLSHPSIAAFLTHGGWNSTIEAISSGVPLLTWPDFADQKFQCHQVTEDWQVGLPLLRPGDGTAVQKEEVERLVISLTRGLVAEQLRARCGALRLKAQVATLKGSGSSARDLQDIIQLVKSKVAAAAQAPPN